MHTSGGHLPPQDPHRTMSHYAASGLPPGPLSAALSSSAQGARREKHQQGRGFDPSQAQAAAQGAGNGTQGKPGEAAGAESSKKRKSASSSQDDVTAGGQAGSNPARQQQLADQGPPYLQQPQYRAMGLD